MRFLYAQPDVEESCNETGKDIEVVAKIDSRVAAGPAPRTGYPTPSSSQVPLEGFSTLQNIRKLARGRMIEISGAALQYLIFCHFWQQNSLFGNLLW